MKSIIKEHLIFFASELPGAFKKYMKYGDYPKNALDHQLRTDEYEHIIHEFWEWVNRDLKALYLPDEDRGKKDLCLVKARYFVDKSEDVAYFGDVKTEIQGRKALLRITQTGGLNSSLYVFVNYPDLKENIFGSEAETILIDTMKDVLNYSSVIEAQIEGISLHDGIFEILKKPVERWTRHLQTFGGFLYRNTVCLTFRKIAFSEDNWDVPAREPRLDEWFEYGRC